MVQLPAFKTREPLGNRRLVLLPHPKHRYQLTRTEFVQPFLVRDICPALLQCRTLEEFLSMAQIAPGLPAAAHSLPLAKSTDLELTHAGKRACAMPGQMLTPDVYGAETFFMGSFHDPDPSMGSRGLDRLSA